MTSLKINEFLTSSMKKIASAADEQGNKNGLIDTCEEYNCIFQYYTKNQRERAIQEDKNVILDLQKLNISYKEFKEKLSVFLGKELKKAKEEGIKVNPQNMGLDTLENYKIKNITMPFNQNFDFSF